MSISKINNNFYLSESRYNLPSLSVRNFKATKISNGSDEFSAADEHANLINKFSDKDMLYLASREPDNRLSKVAANAFKTLFVTIPAVDTFLSGTLKSGNLSSKMLKSASTASKWAAVFAAGASVFATKQFVNSRSEFFEDFNNKHPFLSRVIDFVAVYGAFNAITSGVTAVKERGKRLFPSLVKTLHNRVKAPVKTALNNSFVNKKIVVNAERFMTKRPYLNIMSKVAGFLFVPVTAISVLVRFNNEEKLRNEQVKGNYTALKFINDTIPDNVD